MRFYFDFISPFGYFAALRIDALAARYGREVEWRPMLLGVTVLKVMGLKPLPSHGSSRLSEAIDFCSPKRGSIAHCAGVNGRTFPLCEDL